MTPSDCYRLLGLPDGASAEAVKLAYRRRARLLHPDVNTHDQAASEKFIQLTTAYERLRDFAPVAPPPSPVLTPEQQLKRNIYQQLQALLKNQRLPRAIALIEALVQRLPEDMEVKQWQSIVYHQRARQLMRSATFVQAEAYLLKASRIDPSNQSLLADIEHDLRQIKRMKRQASMPLT
jgi:tetratricopeptide (TPR) repeat protein